MVPPAPRHPQTRAQTTRKPPASPPRATVYIQACKQKYSITVTGSTLDTFRDIRATPPATMSGLHTVKINKSNVIASISNSELIAWILLQAQLAQSHTLIQWSVTCLTYFHNFQIDKSNIFKAIHVFRWFKFTLKPPYSGASERSLLAIWDTSHWNFFVKFGLRTA